MNKFERAMLESGLELMGLYFFAAFGAVSLVNAVLRFFASVWIYTMDGHDITHAGLAFALATLCFIAAFSSRSGFICCWKTLLRNQPTE